MGQKSLYSAFAVYSVVGVQFAVSVIVCLALGNYLDKKLGTLPWLTITGMVLGFVGGVVNLLKIVKYFNKRPGDY